MQGITKDVGVCMCEQRRLISYQTHKNLNTNPLHLHQGMSKVCQKDVNLKNK